MKAKLLGFGSLLAILWAFSIVAQPLNSSSDDIVTSTGVTYKGVKVQKTTPDGLVISYVPISGGIGVAKLKFTDLPNDLQQRYGYNPTNAATFEQAERRTMGQLSERMVEEDRKAAAEARAEQVSNEWSRAVVASAGSGTGFFITDDGYLLTCYHVVTNATRIQVGTTQGIFHADLVRFDAVNDIALLKVAGKFGSLPLAPSNSVRLGESVFTVGFPNPSMQGLAPKLTRGEISSLAGAQDDPGEFQISVPVQPGNSGGALVDEYGNIVGIVAARLSDQAALATSGMIAQDVNYAVKSSRAKPLLETMPGLADELKSPHAAKERAFQNVVQEAENAVALVIVE